MALNLGISRSASQNIGTASVTVLDANRGRQYLFIQNLDIGTDDIFVSIDGTTPVADAPGNIKLTPGAYVEFDGGGLVPTAAIKIIADAASTPVTVLEG